MQSVQIDAVLLVPADINNRLLIDADDVVIAMQAAAAATRWQAHLRDGVVPYVPLVRLCSQRRIRQS